MPKEVLLYGSIFDRSSIDFINAINEVETEGGDLTVRLNTMGGDVLQGWGMVAKFKEFAGNKKLKVDGAAYSMGLFFAIYADEVEALDVSQFMLHRASYGQWYEENYMSDAERDNLIQTNADLMKAFKNRIDVEAFEKIKGVKVKDVFSMEDRLDVFLTAKEAKKIGLVDKIVNITPAKKSAIGADMARIAASYNSDFNPELLNGQDINKNVEPKEAAASLNNEQKTEKMTKAELKAKHPELFAEVLNAGVAQERDRTGAWLTFNDIDAAAVTEGIKSGEGISQTAMADFQKKTFSKNAVNAIENEGGETPDPKVEDENRDEPEATATEKFEAEMRGNFSELGTNTEKS